MVIFPWLGTPMAAIINYAETSNIYLKSCMKYCYSKSGLGDDPLMNLCLRRIIEFNWTEKLLITNNIISKTSIDTNQNIFSHFRIVFQIDLIINLWIQYDTKLDLLRKQYNLQLSALKALIKFQIKLLCLSWFRILKGKQLRIKIDVIF